MQIPQYESQITPQGEMNVRATPEDFGSMSASALGQVGAAGQQLGTTFMRIQDDQARITAANQMADLYVQKQTEYQQARNSLDTSAPDYLQQSAALADKFHQDWQDTTSQLQQNAPDRYTAKYIGMHSATYGRQLGMEILHTQANDAAAYTGQQMLDMGKKATDIVAANPSNDSYKQTLDNYRATVNGLNSISPEAKIKLVDGFEKQLALTQVSVMRANDPQGFLQSIGAQGGIVKANGAVKGQVPGGAPGQPALPQNFGADKVQPYSAARIQQIVQTVTAPSQYDTLFQQAAQQYGLDWRELKMRSVAESGLKAGATSSQGAKGLMQFTPDTAKQWGVTVGDPQSEIFGAAKMLASYSQQAGGDASKIDKMYYGGPGGTAWGKNTNQYAANLAAVRGAMGGSQQVPALPGADLPSVQQLSDGDIAASNPAIAGWEKLDWTQKVQQVREAESMLNAQLSAKRGDMTKQVQEAIAVNLDGKYYPGSENWSKDTFTSLFGAKGESLWQQYDNSVQVGSAVRNMSGMTAAQVADTLQKLQPQPGENYIELGRQYKVVQAAAQQMQKSIMDSPAQYAVDNGLNGAKPLVNAADPKDLAATMRTREAALNNLRINWGAQPEVFTKNELEAVQGVVEKSNSATTLSMLAGLRSAFQDPRYYNAAIAQLGTKNPALAAAGDIITKQGTVNGEDANTVARKVLDGSIALGGKDMTDPSIGGKRAYQVDDAKFRNMFYAVAGDAFKSANGRDSAGYMNQIFDATRDYLVGDAVQKGINPQQLLQSNTYVKAAFDAVTGGVVQQGKDKLFKPWGMTDQDFNAKFPLALQQALQSSGVKGTPLDLPSAYRYANMGNGKYIAMTGGLPIIGPKGMLTVDLSKLAPAPVAVVSQNRAPVAAGAPTFDWFGMP